MASWLDTLFGTPDEEAMDSRDDALNALGIDEYDYSNFLKFQANPMAFCLEYLNLSFDQYSQAKRRQTMSKSELIEELVPQMSSFMQMAWLAFATMKTEKQTDKNWRSEEWTVHLDRAKTILNSFNSEQYSTRQTLRIMNHLFYMLYTAKYGVRLPLPEQAMLAATALKEEENQEEKEKKVEIVVLPENFQQNVENW